MRYVLKEAATMAEARGIQIGLEPHQQYSKTVAGLDRIYGLVDSPAIGINFDTGNAAAFADDPVALLDQVVDRVVSVHASDTAVRGGLQHVLLVTGVTPYDALF